MLNEQKTAKDSELHGRQSGSLAWKLARGETDQQVCLILFNQICFFFDN
jgi:hypothetical protein